MKRYCRSELSKIIKKEIKKKEQCLDRTCRMIWEFTNPKGERFLFANFCKNRDRLVVTLGYFHPYLHKFVPEYPGSL